MCGIIGIIAKEPVAAGLLEGLRRLEYRGYDSAGIATLVDGHIECRRAEGKLVNLARRLDLDPAQGVIGIGHTRWATHGMPTETNAHPIATDRVAVVHNGIIENFQALRHELTALGYTFRTETDTEAVAILATHFLAQGLAPPDAVAKTLARLHGAFALVFLFAGEHDLLIGARRGSPLAIGYGDGEMFLGSDALALAPLTRRITYLEEGDWAVVTSRAVKIFDAANNEVDRPIREAAASGALIGKGNYRHFMQKEIFEQPAVIGDTLHALVNPATRTVHLPELPFALGELDRMTMIACGTAYHACVVAKYWLERIARITVEVDIASEFRYRAPAMPRGGAAMFVSQSGETADTLAALRYAKEQGQKIIAIVNQPESSIAREADVVLPTLAGPEIGVASTKAFTTQLAVLACFTVALARARGAIGHPREAELVAALTEIPSRAQRRAEPRRAAARDRSRDRRGARRALSRPRHRLSAGSRGCPKAEGDLLHPCRGLCCRRDEARADRADRRGGAGHRAGAARRSLRKDARQCRGGHGARRPRRDDLGRGRGWPDSRTGSLSASRCRAATRSSHPCSTRSRSSSSPTTSPSSRGPMSTSRVTSRRASR